MVQANGDSYSELKRLAVMVQDARQPQSLLPSPTNSGSGVIPGVQERVAASIRCYVVT